MTYTNTKNKTTGAIILECREHLNMTQDELAVRLDYGYANFISMLENGRSKLPLNKVFVLAAALDIDELCLLERVLAEREECQVLHGWLFGPGSRLRAPLEAAWGRGV